MSLITGLLEVIGHDGGLATRAEESGQQRYGLVPHIRREPLPIRYRRGSLKQVQLGQGIGIVWSGHR